MRSLAYVLATSVTCALGIAYAQSDGPFVLLEGEPISSRALSSSGGDDWFGITAAMLFFALPLAAAIKSYSSPIRPSILLLIYSGAFLVGGAILFLVNLDSSLFTSIAPGDRLLLFGIVVPSASFCAFVADYVVATFSSNVSDGSAA